MKEEKGFAYQVLLLIIIIIIAIAGVLINQVVGKDGFINRMTEMETEYSKEDVLEKINHKVTQKFIALNNTAKENNQNISDLYNTEVVIEFLKQNLIIEEIYDETGNFQEGMYDINVGKLKEEEKEVHYIGKFQLEKIQEKYMVIWYNEKGEKNRRRSR